VLVDGQSVSFRHEAGQLVIDAPAADAFTLEIRNTICPEKNTELSGLYTSGGGFLRSARRRASAASPTSSIART